MDYLVDVFLPSRNRVIKRLFSKHPWIMHIRSFIMGDSFSFGVKMKSNDETTEYVLHESPEGHLTSYDGTRDIDFKLLGIPLNLVFVVEKKLLMSWVEDEEKLMRHPLIYFLQYMFRLIPKMRFF